MPVKNALRFALITFLAFKILTTLVIGVSAKLIPPNPPEAVSEPSVVKELLSYSRFGFYFLSPWYRWDTAHYLQISDEGYTAHIENTVWPPVYPLLIRLFNLVIKPSMLAALVVSNLATISALFLLYLLVADYFGEQTARHVVVWTVLFPSAFFLVAAYTESLFLTFAAGSLLAARHKRWWLAGLSGALATMTRLPGLALAVPLLWMGLQEFRGWPPRERWLKALNVLAALSLLPISIVVFSLAMHFGLGADWPWKTLSAHWNLHFAMPWTGILGNLKIMAREEISFTMLSQIFDVFLAMWALLWLIVGLRRLPVELSLYTAVLLFPAITKILSNNTLMSVNRYLLPIFPLLVVQDMMLKPRAPRIFWGLVNAVGQGVLLYMFYRWFWVA